MCLSEMGSSVSSPLNTAIRVMGTPLILFTIFMGSCHMQKSVNACEVVEGSGVHELWPRRCVRSFRGVHIAPGPQISLSGKMLRVSRVPRVDLYLIVREKNKYCSGNVWKVRLCLSITIASYHGNFVYSAHRTETSLPADITISSIDNRGASDSRLHFCLWTPC